MNKEIFNLIVTDNFGKKSLIKLTKGDCLTIMDMFSMVSYTKTPYEEKTLSDGITLFLNKIEI